MKTFMVKVVSYAQKTYQIQAKSLKEAKKKYKQGSLVEGEDCTISNGGALDGEIINEEWEE